jgi:hypothetical protein
MKTLFTILAIMAILTVALIPAATEPVKAEYSGSWITATTSVSSNTTTPSILLDGQYIFMVVELPALAVTNVTFKVSSDNSTWRDLITSDNITQTTGLISKIITIGGYQYIKVVCSANQTAPASVNVRGYGY